MSADFGHNSTADDVLGTTALHGRHYVVTGISSGVGAETARGFVARGAEVTGTVRDAAKAAAAVETIARAATEGGGRLDVVEADVASLDSIRYCTDGLRAAHRGIDAIIANAGVMATPFGRTADGFETQFGTNHLGHFLFVNRLAPQLNPDARVVVLSSNGHRGADVDLDDPNFEHTTYDPWIAYNRSKTANSLFAVEFDRRYRDRGVRACAVMPGTAMTPIMRHLSPDDLKAVFSSIDADRIAAGEPPLALKSVPQMAATTAWAVVVADAEEIGGRYLEDCHVAEIDDVPGIRGGVMSYALDPARARQLWALSETLVGERF